MPGWPEELTEVRSYAALPAAARRYVERIGELLGRPVSFVSVGPDRDQTIFCETAARDSRPWPRPQPRTPAPA
jgi:adenylosuccinate synthase